MVGGELNVTISSSRKREPIAPAASHLLSMDISAWRLYMNPFAESPEKNSSRMCTRPVPLGVPRAT